MKSGQSKQTRTEGSKAFRVLDNQDGPEFGSTTSLAKLRETNRTGCQFGPAFDDRTSREIRTKLSANQH